MTAFIEQKSQGRGHTQITSKPKRNTSMKKTTTPTLVELEEQLNRQKAEAANLRSQRTGTDVPAHMKAAAFYDH